MNTFRIESKEAYTIVHLERGKANAINQEMVNELIQFFKEAANDNNIGGIVLTGQPKFFSAGLDVIELYSYDKGQMKTFWDSFTELMMVLASFPKPFVSAITGHSPAGGCVLAICSDYRVMAEGEKFKIGLNEVPVGIPVPHGIYALYKFWLGEGRAYQALMEGKMFTPQEALTVGLVDTIVPMDEVLVQAEAKMQQYLALPVPVWLKTKEQLRQNLVADVIVTEEEKEAMLAIWWSDAMRNAMGAMVASLQERK